MKLETASGYFIAGNEHIAIAINCDDPEDCHHFIDRPDHTITAFECAIEWANQPPGG